MTGWTTVRARAWKEARRLHTTAFRLQLLWEPNDKFSGLLKVHGWDVDGTARIFRANIFEPGTNNLVDGFQQDQVWHDGQNSQDIESRRWIARDSSTTSAAPP